jgi:hypothetical protein
MRGPAKVPERRRPELRGRHCERKALAVVGRLKKLFARSQDDTADTGTG